jgi:acetyltransferase-like isoleucine patch superfamily enzyme
MQVLLRRMLNDLALRRVRRRSQVDVAANAKVNWRGIQHRPPSRISIGSGSIFEGTITSDREGSSVVIGENTFIGNSSIVTAECVEIGSDVLISWGCTIADHDSHTLNWSGRTGDVRAFYDGTKNWKGVNICPVRIRDKAWIGFNVIILKGVTIGEGAVVAAGSLVTRNVPDYVLVAGNPARTIRSVLDVAH